MTSKPELRDTSSLAPALAAVALFVVMAAVFVGSPVGASEGFPQTAETVNVSIGEGDVSDRASITTQNGSTVVVVEGDDGNETTNLVDETGDVNGSIIATGGQTYAVVNEPVSITESIGYAMFGLSDSADVQVGVGSESFLAVFEIIAMVLVAALVGAVMLARREEAGEVVDLFGSSQTPAEGDAVAADGGIDEVDGTDDRDGGDA